MAVQDFEKINGLLFYLSGKKTFNADFSAGDGAPTFCEAAEIKRETSFGNYIECSDTQKLAWRAPGNIYAERGTLSFFWRSRYAVGPTPFPVFRVAFADSSSWDAVWLRIDYNGEGGFDAFVTDINLSRTRVRAKPESFPTPDKWIHITFAWDENTGVKLWLDGELAAEKSGKAVYFTGLDQFGPHSRIISNWNVVSAYNFMRGGDISKIAVYDRMLDQKSVSALAAGKLAEDLEPFMPSLTDAAHRAEWLHRCGFDNPAALPPELEGQFVMARKVEIHNAYDIKRWWWKACDGIRETTWPGVYNRSRLPGRNDYFQLPDWDCYSTSGKAVTFELPDESYNHIEISGSAFGKAEELDGDGNIKSVLFERPEGVERSFHGLSRKNGGKIRFTNVMQEEPIGDFSVFNITGGIASSGLKSASYYLRAGVSAAATEAEKELTGFIEGRYTAYERNIVTAVAAGSGGEVVPGQLCGFPFYNIVIPYEYDQNLGLDGVELTFQRSFSPALMGKKLAVAAAIKDPLWYYRNLAHLSFTIDTQKPYTLFIDTRDRILPENKCLYITLSFSEMLTAKEIENISLRLVYKSAQEAKAEHCADRLTQVRDIYAHLVEEHPRGPKFNMFNRFYGDITDLLKHDPKNFIAQCYFYDKMVLNKRYAENEKPIKFKPDYTHTPVPADTPEWAYRQVEFLKFYKRLINWYIDNRQIENGEFGGGLSDDGDFTSWWPALALMGSDSEKVKQSLYKCTDAFYAQGMFTNGLPTIQTDDLHSAEEGLISLGQCLALEMHSPKYLELCMETARALWWLTGINKAGHRHIKSSYFSGTVMATEHPWNITSPSSYIAVSPCLMLARYNGNEMLTGLLSELADGLLAHLRDGVLHSDICFDDDSDAPPRNAHGTGEANYLVAAYRMTKDEKYLAGAPDYNPLARCSDEAVDFAAIAKKYEALVFAAACREYINTEGSPWIDRVVLDIHDIQCDRLGGPAYMRFTAFDCRNRISWQFANEGDDECLGIYVAYESAERVRIIVYNMSAEPVSAKIIGGDLAPGKWTAEIGIDADGDGIADKKGKRQMFYFGRFDEFETVFAPKKTTVVTLTLSKEAQPYSKRCDLGISREDVRFFTHGMNVRVHSLGNIASPESTIALKAADGTLLKAMPIPSIPAPADLYPKSWDITFNLFGIEDLSGCYLEIDPDNKLNEITRANNIVRL